MTMLHKAVEILLNLLTEKRLNKQPVKTYIFNKLYIQINSDGDDWKSNYANKYN